MPQEKRDKNLDVDSQGVQNQREEEENTINDPWQAMRESLTYTNRLATFYWDTFLSETARKSSQKITAAHADEARDQAAQALQLIASSVLDLSVTINASIDAQFSEAVRINKKMEQLKHRMMLSHSSNKESDRVMGDLPPAELPIVPPITTLLPSSSDPTSSSIETGFPTRVVSRANSLQSSFSIHEAVEGIES